MVIILKSVGGKQEEKMWMNFMGLKRRTDSRLL
jgi:hypothetical protein